MADLVEMAKKGNGYISFAQVTSAGIPRRLLVDAVASDKLVQVERGLYVLPGTWEDELYIAQRGFARGIFSGETVLYLHGMTDRAPVLVHYDVSQVLQRQVLRRARNRLPHVLRRRAESWQM